MAAHSSPHITSMQTAPLALANVTGALRRHVPACAIVLAHCTVLPVQVAKARTSWKVITLLLRLREALGRQSVW